MAEETKCIKPSSKTFSQFVDGFQIPGMYSADSFRSALSYKPRPGDFFLVTYPKCGTTWAQNMLTLIFRQGEPADQDQVYASSPFLEMAGAEAAETMPRPGVIKVHLPFHLVPWSDKAKYIYITRNPMDCCVSFFYHMKKMPGHGFDGTFDDFFEMFISGQIDYGDYFDHLLGWYSHRDDPNVLFMTYEEMKEDPSASVLKMASFLDDELYAEPLRKDYEKLVNVIRYSSFEHMKKAVNKHMLKIMTMSEEDLKKSNLPKGLKDTFQEMLKRVKTEEKNPAQSEFVRKGIIGDWKNHFSADQCKRIKDKFEERTRGTDIPQLFEKYML